MGRTRESANLVSENNIFVDITNDLVGIGTTVPTVELDVSGNAKVSGIITATTFSGPATQIMTVRNETSDNFYFTFVDDVSSTSSANYLYSDTALNLNPYTNIVSGGGMDMVAYFINSVEITATATEINFLDGSTAGSAVASKALVVDANRDIDNLGIITATTFSGPATQIKTQTTTTSSNHYLTFVDSNNGSATAETVYTDVSLHYNPVVNQFTAPAMNTTILSLDGTDVTSTAAELNLLDGSTAGSAVASKALVVDSNRDIDNLGNVTLVSTDAGSAAGPELTLYRNSSSPSPSDYLGQLMFKGENSNGGQENYAKITGKITDETLGTEDGLIETAIKGDGSFTIVSRQRSDELQLINGVGLSVEGDITANGNVVGDNSTNISGISSVTATSFHGDGSNLTNVPTGFSPINFVLS